MNSLDIKNIREKLSITQDDLSKRIGVSLRTIQNWESGETIPKTKYEILRNLLKDHNIVNEPKEEYLKSSNFIPLIPIEAIAGKGNGSFTICKTDILDSYVIPEFTQKGIEYIIRVSGSSMYPKYSSGDLLGCKTVTDLSFFQWGKIYILDTDQGPMVKRLFPVNDNSEMLECRSDNKEYPPFLISKSSIFKIAIVLGVLRLE